MANAKARFERGPTYYPSTGGTCELCQKRPAEIVSVCFKCFKQAARNAARWALKIEMKKNYMLFDPYAQAQRLKSLTNSFEKRIKRGLKRRAGSK